MLLALMLSAAAADTGPTDTGPTDTGPTWTVQVDPLTTALGFVHVQVERAITPRVSLYAGPHLRLFNGLISEPSEAFRGYGLETGVRFFPWGEAPEGAWVMTRGVFAYLHATDGSGERSTGGYRSALAGYTWIPGDRWVLSGGLGVQYIDYQVAGMGPVGLLPAAHTALGVAF